MSSWAFIVNAKNDVMKRDDKTYTVHTAYSVSARWDHQKTDTVADRHYIRYDYVYDYEPRRVLREEWSTDIWKRGNRAGVGYSNNFL